MGFAKGVTAGAECHGFVVVHRHTLEGFADVACGGNGVGVAVRPLWIHIDQTHLNGAKWLLKLTVTGVALVAEPRVFRSPVDVLAWFPNIFTAAREADGLKAHRVHCDIPGEYDQVGP